MTHRRVIAFTVFAIGLSGLVAGCASSNDSSGPKGSLAITMRSTSAPTAGAVQTATADGEEALPHLKAAVITVAGIEARMADGTWVPMETGFPADADIIAIMNAGNVAELSADFLPEGDYDALQMRITQVRLTPMGDTMVSITPSESGWTVQIPVNFSVISGQATGVELKLRCGDSLRLFDGQFEFDPEIDVFGVEHDS